MRKGQHHSECRRCQKQKPEELQRSGGFYAWEKYSYLASSWFVVTEAMALLTTSNLIPSGGTRSCTASSLSEIIVPRMPPVVVMRSPGFKLDSISCHCF